MTVAKGTVAQPLLHVVHEPGDVFLGGDEQVTALFQSQLGLLELIENQFIGHGSPGYLEADGIKVITLGNVRLTAGGNRGEGVARQVAFNGVMVEDIHRGGCHGQSLSDSTGDHPQNARPVSEDQQSFGRGEQGQSPDELGFGGM